MRIITNLFIIVILLLGIGLACLNASTVKINYYIGSASLPMSLLLIVVLAIGVIMGSLIGITHYLRLRREVSRLKHQLKVAEKEIENLRAIPLKDV